MNQVITTHGQCGVGMNEFTKEELEDLEYWLRVTSKQDITLPSGKDLFYLQDKIQSMIDDYCEYKSESSVLTSICCNIEWHYFKHNKGVAQCHNCLKILN